MKSAKVDKTEQMTLYKLKATSDYYFFPPKNVDIFPRSQLLYICASHLQDLLACHCLATYEGTGILFVLFTYRKL